MSAAEEPRSFPIAKIAIAVAAIAGLALLYHFLPVREWLEAFKHYVATLGPLGWIVYALAYALCCVLFIPASVLTLGAGAIFGVVKGSIIVIAGATLGATLSFILARTILRKRIESMTATNEKFRALDQALTREGWKIVVLVRLSIVFPFTYINYAFGLTGIALGPYILATFIGIIPATVAFVYLGDAAGAAATATRAQTTALVVKIIGGVIALLVSLFVARIATKAIKRAGVAEKPAA
ncbi:MAG: hypothetical protein JWO56_173 [Acidobacteria bacterium]|nr:hypothetical protein [Acidobacteriota bacterium]